MEIKSSHNSGEENRLSQPRMTSSEEHFVSAVFHLTNQSDAKKLARQALNMQNTASFTAPASGILALIQASCSRSILSFSTEE
jgi:hypothetical protein